MSNLGHPNAGIELLMDTRQFQLEIPYFVKPLL